MSYQYPRFFLDIQLAKRRLAQVFEAARGLDSDRQSPSMIRSALVTKDQNEAAKRKKPAQDRTRIRNIFRNPTRNQRWPKRSDRTKSDMTGFCFTLTLLLIETIAATHTDRPVFWLLIGPAPLAAGLTTIAFFRQRFGRRGRFLVAGKRDR